MRVNCSLALLSAVLITLRASAQLPADPQAQHRAGNPFDVAPWARPSDTGRYVGYTVGGGNASVRKGEPPARDDGTWGWDFQGGLIRRRVILNWWHGRRYQGGVGAYETERIHR